MSQAHANKWEIVLKHLVIHEKNIDEDKYIVSQIVSLLKEVKLFSIVTYPKKFGVHVVREMTANLPEDFGNSSSPLFDRL